DDVRAAGTLALTAAGNIGQVANTSVKAIGLATVQAGNGTVAGAKNITLNSANNEFSMVKLLGNNVLLNDADVDATYRVPNLALDDLRVAGTLGLTAAG